MTAPHLDPAARVRLERGPTALDRAAVVLNRFPSKLAFTLIVLGFLAIAVGLAGMRDGTTGPGSVRILDLRAQLPYLMSGGIGGLALVITGCTLLKVQSHRDDSARVEGLLADLLAAQLDTSATVTAAAAVPATSFGPAGRSTQDVGLPSAPNDVTGLVVAGASSFHVPSCRLVKGRPDPTYLPAEEALSRGLAPCRVCKSDLLAHN